MRVVEWHDLVRGRPRDHRIALLRYIAVGASGYVLAMAFYGLLLLLDVSPYAAVPPTFVMNGLYNFTLNRMWSFAASGAPLQRELARFTAIAAVSLVVNYATLFLLHDVAGMTAFVAQALAIVVATPVGFLGNKYWSFAAAEKSLA
jgi:putative flippase GtrA